MYSMVYTVISSPTNGNERSMNVSSRKKLRNMEHPILGRKHPGEIID